MESLVFESSNFAAEQQCGRLRLSCMETVSDNNRNGDEAGSGATEEAAPAASELLEQVFLAIRTMDRQVTWGGVSRP
jgi:hypothetical protein